jgi:phage shock protein A
MGIFSRLSDLIAANINALIDKAEDPERMLSQVIREMEDGLLRARQQAATAITAERRLGRELEQNRRAAEHWREQARIALSHGREDLARKALARKIEHADLADALEAQHAGALQTSTDVKTALRALESRLAEAGRQQRILMARHRAARIRLDVQRTVATAVPDVHTPFAKFARFEERLLDMEDHLLAQVEVSWPGSLDAEVAELEMQKRIDEELATLKRDTP